MDRLLMISVTGEGRDFVIAALIYPLYLTHLWDLVRLPFIYRLLPLTTPDYRRSLVEPSAIFLPVQLLMGRQAIQFCYGIQPVTPVHTRALGGPA